MAVNKSGYVALIQSDDWKDRLRGEYWELQDRIHSLQAFIKARTGSIIMDEPKTSTALLQEQLKVMKSYKHLLEDRATRDGIDL